MQRVLDVAHRFGAEIAGDRNLNGVLGLEKRPPILILKEGFDSVGCWSWWRLA
jgi:hypothetical protein